MLLLGSIGFFVFQSSSNNKSAGIDAPAANSTAARDPLDQISTVDIALNLAQMAKLAETRAVASQADSVSTQLAVPAQTTIIAKPQAVATELKSNKDIVTYVTKDGDTIASVASKFNVTSESIIWSNNLSGNTVASGVKLVIPPVTGIVYTVKDGDTPDTLAQKYRANKDQIIAYNDAEISGLKTGKLIIIPNGQQVITPTRTASLYSGGTSYVASYAGNQYDRGFCTWYVADRRMVLGRPLPSNLGDAFTWDDNALGAGIRVDTIPEVGAAIVTKTTTGPGHVAIVEAVNDDGSVWISEMNSSGQVSMTDTRSAGGWGRVDFKLIPASQARSYNYIH